MAEHRTHSPDVRAVSERTRKMSRTMTMCATSHIREVHTGKSDDVAKNEDLRDIPQDENVEPEWPSTARTNQMCARSHRKILWNCRDPRRALSLPTRRPASRLPAQRPRLARNGAAQSPPQPASLGLTSPKASRGALVSAAPPARLRIDPFRELVKLPTMP